ncbi:MAG: DUF1501 domain-containing protein [Myxococcota bacterium]
MPSISRRELLGGGAALLAASGAPRIARGGSSPPSNLVVVFAIGGWDTTYSIDGKLGLPGIEGPEVDRGADPDDVDEVETFGGIPIVVNDVRRPEVGRFFRNHHQRSLLVNGVFCGAIGHDLARGRMLTGTDSPSRPDLTVMFGVERSPDLPVAAFDLSTYQLTGEYASSTARLATRDQLARLIDPVGLPPTAPVGRTYPLWSPSDAQEAAMNAFTARRVDGMRARWGEGGHNDRRLDAELEAADRAVRLREIGREVVLDAPLHIIQRVPLALDLLTSGATRSILMHHEDFDTHYETAGQNRLQDEFFLGLSMLADGLDERGLLDDTLVMVVSEMTRSPMRNAFDGKDHWPHTNALFFGGGIVGDRVLGGTNGIQESLPIDLATGERWDGGTLLRHDQLIAGTLAGLGVDPARWLPGVTPWGGLLA